MGRSWTDDFSDVIEELADERPDIVALTAAMLIPVGLKGFASGTRAGCLMSGSPSNTR